MKIAITGGTGFVGRTLARTLLERGHAVNLIARGIDRSDPDLLKLRGICFHRTGLNNTDALRTAFAGCQAVVHCAGINREIGNATFENVHVRGTQNVITAARLDGVRKIVLTSFLRARPNCGSVYHESKWAAEELVRNSGLDYTILKPGVIYGRGDHMLDHLSRAFHTFPVFGFVGFRDKFVRPIAVEDIARLLLAAVTKSELTRQTIAVLGPEQLTLRQAVRRVAAVVGKHPLMIPLPLWFHYGFAALIERLMVVPMVSVAQIRMLSEGLAEALPDCELPPSHLAPMRPFSDENISKGLPPIRPFGTRDLIFCRKLKPRGAI